MAERDGEPGGDPRAADPRHRLRLTDDTCCDQAFVIDSAGRSPTREWAALMMNGSRRLGKADKVASAVRGVGFGAAGADYGDAEAHEHADQGRP